MFQSLPKLLAVTIMTSLLLGCESDDDDLLGSDDNIAGFAPGIFETQRNSAMSSMEAPSAMILSPTGLAIVIEGSFSITLAEIQFDEENLISGTGVTIMRGDVFEPAVSYESSISGSAESKDRGEVIVSNVDGVTGSYVLMRDIERSDQKISLPMIAGVYTNYDSGSVLTVVTVASDGAITGSDERGCVLNGELRIPDTSSNVFEVFYTAELCPDDQRNGEYIGVGSVDAEKGFMIFGATNASVATVYEGIK